MTESWQLYIGMENTSERKPYHAARLKAKHEANDKINMHMVNISNLRASPKRTVKLPLYIRVTMPGPLLHPTKTVCPLSSLDIRILVS